MGLRVLVLDADVAAADARARELTKDGYDVVRASDVTAAAEVLMREAVDSIVCSDALRAEVERAYASVLPVVPVGGQSTALLAKTLARLSRRSVSPTAQLSLEAQLDAALADAALVLEPIVDLRDGSVRAHRATLLAPSLTEEQVAGIAAELGRVLELRHTARRLACDAIDRGASRLLLACTIEDLLDPQLYDARSPWGEHAERILLVVAERDVLVLAEADARHRMRSLRDRGFSLVARVGTDIAGLTTVGLVVPSYALLDVSAFGQAGPVLTRIVASVVSACREIDVEVIAEVATADHAACARATGCVLAVGRGIQPGASA